MKHSWLRRAVRLAADSILGPAPQEQYLIWSNYHRMWWRPDAAGYTLQLEKAGRYERGDAILRCRLRDQHYDSPLPEIPVRESDVLLVHAPSLAHASLRP